MTFPVDVGEWRVYAGDDTELPLVFKDAEGAPVDLSDWQGWRAQWCRRAGETAGAVDIPVVVSPVEGRVVLTLSAEASREVRSGVWDVQATRDGTVRTWARGRISWEEDVTR